MWNAISLVQNLNSCQRVHFLQRYHYSTGSSFVYIRWLYAFHFQGQILVFACTFCQCDTFSVSCTIFHHYHFTPCEFFIYAFAAGISQESERQHVFSGIQVSSQYLTDQTNAVVWMVSILSMSQSAFQSFGGHSKRTRYNWYHCYLHVTIFILCKVQVSDYLLIYLIFNLWSVETAKSFRKQVLSFFYQLALGLVIWPVLGDSFVSQNHR